MDSPAFTHAMMSGGEPSSSQTPPSLFRWDAISSSTMRMVYSVSGFGRGTQNHWSSATNQHLEPRFSHLPFATHGTRQTPPSSLVQTLPPTHGCNGSHASPL